MSMLIESISESLRNTLIPSVERGGIGVAVSGGADSVALLCGLAALRATRSFRLVVFHVDHGLHEDSNQDATWVSNLALKYGLEFFSASLQPSVDELKKLGIEAWARRERYQAMATMTKRAKVAWVALGHTCDDQAEGLMMRLIAGSSPDGLQGMPVYRKMKASGISIRIWRPLLSLRGKELREYLKTIGQSWREDPSNTDMTFMRNRIRHEVLPAIEDFSSRAVIHISRFAKDVRRLQQGKRKIVLHALRNISPRFLPLPIKLPREWFLDAIHCWLIQEVPEVRLTRDVLVLIQNLIIKNHAGKAVPVGKWFLIREPQGLRIIEKNELSNWDDFAVTLSSSSPVCIREFLVGVGFPRKDSSVISVPEGVRDSDLCVRSVQPGDFFRPPGRSRLSSLSRWMIKQKVPVVQRRKFLVVASGREVYAILGWKNQAAFPSSAPNKDKCSTVWVTNV